MAEWILRCGGGSGATFRVPRNRLHQVEKLFWRGASGLSRLAANASSAVGKGFARVPAAAAAPAPPASPSVPPPAQAGGRVGGGGGGGDGVVAAVTWWAVVATGVAAAVTWWVAVVAVGMLQGCLATCTSTARKNSAALCSMMAK